jgi:uncharacterized short protein YbdD (DUF466 family)
VTDIIARLERWARQAAAVATRVIGAPDYDRYLAHMRERHPDHAPLTRGEFIASCLSARYDRPGSRCC